MSGVILFQLMFGKYSSDMQITNRYTYAADGRKLRVQYLLSTVVILDDDEGGGGTPMPGPGLGPLSLDPERLLYRIRKLHPNDWERYFEDY